MAPVSPGRPPFGGCTVLEAECVRIPSLPGGSRVALCSSTPFPGSIMEFWHVVSGSPTVRFTEGRAVATPGCGQLRNVPFWRVPLSDSHDLNLICFCKDAIWLETPLVGLVLSPGGQQRADLLCLEKSVVVVDIAVLLALRSYPNRPIPQVFYQTPVRIPYLLVWARMMRAERRWVRLVGNNNNLVALGTAIARCSLHSILVSTLHDGFGSPVMVACNEMYSLMLCLKWHSGVGQRSGSRSASRALCDMSPRESVHLSSTVGCLVVYLEFFLYPQEGPVFLSADLMIDDDGSLRRSWCVLRLVSWQHICVVVPGPVLCLLFWQNTGMDVTNEGCFCDPGCGGGFSRTGAVAELISEQVSTQSPRGGGSSDPVTRVWMDMWRWQDPRGNHGCRAAVKLRLVPVTFGGVGFRVKWRLVPVTDAGVEVFDAQQVEMRLVPASQAWTAFGAACSLLCFVRVALLIFELFARFCVDMTTRFAIWEACPLGLPLGCVSV